MGSNINLLKLAEMLGMGPPKPGKGLGLADLAPNTTPQNQPTHGYTIAEKEPEVVTAPGVYFPSEKGEVLSPESYNEKAGLTELIPRQFGGSVDPSLFKDEMTLGEVNPFGDEAARMNLMANTPMDRYNVNVTTPENAPLRSYYDAHPEEKATGFSPQNLTPIPTSSPTPSLMQIPTSSPNPSLMQIPAFKENKRSPMFASDQKTAFDQKWQPYQDMFKKMGGMPLFPRATGVKVSPDPMEGLTKEEKRLMLGTIGQETATVDMAPLSTNSPDLEPNAFTNTMTLGPPNPQGDEAARDNIGNTLISPELEARKSWEQPGYGEQRLTDIRSQPGHEGAIAVSPGFEKTYYEAHPEERFIDAAAEANKPLVDAYKKLIQEHTNRAQGFGLGINPKAGRLMQTESVKSIPELTAGLEKATAANKAEREKYFSSEMRAGKAGPFQIVTTDKGIVGVDKTGKVFPLGINAPVKKVTSPKLQHVQEDKGDMYRKGTFNPEENDLNKAYSWGEWQKKAPTPSTDASTDKAEMRAKMQLRQQFNSLQPVKDYRDVQARFGAMEEAIKESKKTNTFVAVDQALITLFNKMTDPQSVVRESEYARTPSDMGFVNRVKGKMSKILSGGAGLTNEERNALLSMANRFKSAYEKTYKGYEDEYRGYAEMNKWNPDEVIKQKGGDPLGIL